LPKQLGAVLRDEANFPVMVLRSTVPRGRLIPPSRHVWKRPELKAGVDFGVCFQPEFLREGSSICDFYNPPFTIVGSATSVAVEPA